MYQIYEANPPVGKHNIRNLNHINPQKNNQEWNHDSTINNLSHGVLQAPDSTCRHRWSRSCLYLTHSMSKYVYAVLILYIYIDMYIMYSHIHPRKGYTYTTPPKPYSCHTLCTMTLSAFTFGVFAALLLFNLLLISSASDPREIFLTTKTADRRPASQTCSNDSWGPTGHVMLFDSS